MRSIADILEQDSRNRFERAQKNRIEDDWYYSAPLGGASGPGGGLLTAPTLSWTSGTTDNTPDLTVVWPDILVVGTHFTTQWANNPGFSSPSSDDHTLTAPEAMAQSVDLPLAALADGTWYIRVKYTVGATDSAWSNVETKTIDAAPTLTLPTGVQTGATTATVGATTDQGNGNLYWVVTTGSTPPTAAQVKAGQDSAGATAAASGSQAISSTGVKTANATGLVGATAYYAHLMHEDATAHQSNVASSNLFTTGTSYVGPGDIVSGAIAWGSAARCYSAANMGGAMVDLVDQAGANLITINSVVGTGLINVASITSWVTANSVTTIKITKLYDQTGSGNHFTQVTLANMPELELSALNGLPGIKFSGGTNQALNSAGGGTVSQPFTYSAVAKRIVTGNGGIIGSGGSAVYLGHNSSANLVGVSGGTLITAAATDGTFRALTGVVNGASSAIVVNGSATTGNAGSTAAATNIRIGRANSLVTLGGTIMEAGQWPVAFNATQYGNVTSNQRGPSYGYNV